MATFTATDKVTVNGAYGAGTTYTYSSANIGTAASNRQVIVIIGEEDVSTISSITVGGTSLTKRVASSGQQRVEIWSGNITSGTTANIVVTHSLNYGKIALVVGTLYLGTAAPSASGSEARGYTGTFDVAPTIGSNQVAVSGFFWDQGTDITSLSVSGGTLGDKITGNGFSIASLWSETAGSPQTIAASGVGGDFFSAAYAVWDKDATGVSGTLSVTAGADTVAGTGKSIAKGTTSATAAADTLSGTAKALAKSTLSSTAAGATLAGTGKALASGSLSVTTRSDNTTSGYASAVAKLVGPDPVNIPDCQSINSDWNTWHDNFISYGNTQWTAFLAEIADGGYVRPSFVNYYDRAKLYYAWYYSTGDSTYLDRARTIAADYLIYITGTTPSAHWAQMEGMGLYYLDTGSGAAQIATVADNFCLPYYYDDLDDVSAGSIIDQRIQGRYLQALMVAKHCGIVSASTYGTDNGDFTTKLSAGLTKILSTQDSNGRWFVPATSAVKPFMVGVLMDQLINYYNSISADDRILPAIKKFLDWLWANMYDATSKSFFYIEIDGAGGEPKVVAPDLNGLLMGAFGWVYAMTGDSTYKTRGDLLLQGTNAGAYLTGTKQFNESYSYSYRYLVWAGLLPNKFAGATAQALAKSTTTTTLAGATLAGSGTVVSVNTLSAVSRAVTLTGSSANLTFQHKLAVTGRAATCTGSTVTLKRGLVEFATSNAVALTGSSMVMRTARILAAVTRAVTLTGSSSAMWKGVILTVNGQAVSIAGSSVAMRTARILSATSRAALLSGSAIGWFLGFTAPANSNEIVCTGGAVNIEKIVGRRKKTGKRTAYRAPSTVRKSAQPAITRRR